MIVTTSSSLHLIYFHWCDSIRTRYPCATGGNSAAFASSVSMCICELVSLSDAYHDITENEFTFPINSHHNDIAIFYAVSLSVLRRHVDMSHCADYTFRDFDPSLRSFQYDARCPVEISRFADGRNLCRV